MLDIVTCNFEKNVFHTYFILKHFNMSNKVLVQMRFCYHLIYFKEILILFLFDNFIRWHCYYLYAYNWFNHLGLWWSKTSLFIFLIHFLFIFLSMPIDMNDVTWDARVGIFYSLKSLPKIKSNTKNFPFLTNAISFSLIFFWMSLCFISQMLSML